MKTLLIVGHPRTMTSLIYQVLDKAILELQPLPRELAKNPELKQVGEVLNRSVEVYRDGKRLMPNGVVPYSGPLYFGGNAMHDFDAASNFSLEHVKDTVFDILDRYSEGYLLKVVTQPWLVSEWIHANPGRVKTLHIHRSLSDVCYRMDTHGWYLPIPMSGGRTEEGESTLRLLARGLVRTEREIFNRIDFDETLEWEEVIYNPDLLWEAVEPLGYGVEPYDWFTALHKAIRDDRLSKRHTDRWKECDRIVREEIDRYDRERSTV